MKYAAVVTRAQLTSHFGAGKAALAQRILRVAPGIFISLAKSATVSGS